MCNARWPQRQLLVATALLALGTGATAQAHPQPMPALGGVYAPDCSSGLLPQLKVLGDTLVVQDQGRALLTGRKLRPAPAGTFGPEGFVAALTSEVAAGEMMDFVFTRDAAFLTVSAKTGAGVSKILPEADAVARRSTLKLPTGELNRVLKRAFEAQLPKGRSGRELKIRYAVQVASEPPLIRLFSDRDEPLHFAFERFLQNRLREKWDLAGVPLKFVVRKGE